MQAISNFAVRLLSRKASPGVLTQVATLKSYKPPPKRNEIEYPEKNRLPILPKFPQLLKPYKMQKRLRYIRGPELLHNSLLHKQFGIVAVTGGRIKYGHIEMMRLTIARKLDTKRFFAIWRIDAPWQPMTKRGHGTRMGGGKGAIDHYITPVKAGRIIVEVAGDGEFFEVEKVLKDVANKLPFKARAISQTILEEEAEKEKWLEDNNKNPWTWKYIIQNNLGGCRKWISPVDNIWFNKYR
ncbi:large ribosomal subunit protein uL16m [Prorops nasuta]|uniref:large ribosomal subunit protein uL16m n=1 Tax=Prorops nasuta TaxID=863751 RepID=UPI0034CD94BA